MYALFSKTYVAVLANPVHPNQDSNFWSLGYIADVLPIELWRQPDAATSIFVSIDMYISEESGYGISVLNGSIFETMYYDLTVKDGLQWYQPQSLYGDVQGQILRIDKHYNDTPGRLKICEAIVLGGKPFKLNME